MVYPAGVSKWGKDKQNGATCTWAGNAAVGMAMGTWSYVWIAGDFYTQRQLYLHEIGEDLPGPTWLFAEVSTLL
jgi:hypothetical protein